MCAFHKGFFGGIKVYAIRKSALTAVSLHEHMWFA